MSNPWMFVPIQECKNPEKLVRGRKFAQESNFDINFVLDFEKYLGLIQRVLCNATADVSIRHKWKFVIHHELEMQFKTNGIFRIYIL